MGSKGFTRMICSLFTLAILVENLNQTRGELSVFEKMRVSNVCIMENWTLCLLARMLNKYKTESTCEMKGDNGQGSQNLL